MSIPLLGLAGAAGIGLALGLLGSGGSIVTVPVLVYLFGQGEKQAIAGSLIVVATIAASGALINARSRTVDMRAVLAFAPTGVAGAWIGAAASQHVAGRVQLETFAIIMAAAAASMLKPLATSGHAPVQNAVHAGVTDRSFSRLLAAGLLVGLLTGFVGVGGGFLIVPALVITAGLPMHRAVGSSLVLIAINGLAGFAEHARHMWREGVRLDWAVLAIVAVVGICGVLIGNRFGSRLPAATLRRLFGAALVLLAVFMLLHLPAA